MKGTLEFDRAGEVDSVIIEFEFEPDSHGVEITNVSDIEDYLDRNMEWWLKAGEIETWASQAEYEACEAEYKLMRG